MLRKILVFGAIAGVIIGISIFTTGMIMSRHIHIPHSLVIGYLTMLIALTMVFVGIKRYRDVDKGGVIKFWPALLLGLGISAVAGVFYVAAWEAALAITHMDFAGDYARTVIAEQKARGASAEAIAKLSASMDAFKVAYASPLYRVTEAFGEIFPVGVLVSLVSAGLLRNSRFLPARPKV